MQIEFFVIVRYGIMFTCSMLK